MTESPPLADFEALRPDFMLDAVEAALGQSLTGLAHSHPSYINRVYELQTKDGTRLIAKFYRPGRWSEAALREEHDFVLAAADAEIPVIAPMPLANADTLGQADKYFFALYPKRWGRELDVREAEDWRRLGRVLGRLHLIGARQDAPHRIHMHPDHATRRDINLLLDGHFVDATHRAPFDQLSHAILDLICPLFKDREFIRIHGDCHAANVLDHPDDGLMLIDFDDMAMGVPIQDLWMLLPGNSQETRHEFDLVIEGYEEFREFDWFSIKLIEPLRAMRSLYFWAWCARQTADSGFNQLNPDWGTPNFWAREIPHLEAQLQNIKDIL